MRNARSYRCRPVLGHVVIGLLVSVPLTGQAATPRDQNSDQPSARRLREAQKALDTVAQLDITAAQARSILPLVDQAAAIHLQRYQLQAQLQPQMIDAFTAFAQQDSLNQGFTPEVEKRAAKLSHEAKAAVEEADQKLIDLEEQVRAVLTPAQNTFLSHLRSDGQPAAKPGLGAAESANSDDRLAEARQELAEIERQLHPAPGPIGKLLLHPAAAEPLRHLARARTPETARRAIDTYYSGTREYPIARADADQAQIRRLRAEINNWNLINGLNLNLDQIQAIVNLYGATVASASAAAGRRGPKPDAPGGVRYQLERAVEEVLNPGQREVLADYKPCLIPPKNLKDPVRIGQASDNSQITAWLERARAAPDARRSEMAARLLDEEAKHLGTLDPPEREERAALLLSTARRAADMSDTEFEIGKGDLVAQIAPRDRVRELKREMDQLADQRGVPGVTARFLLQPEFVAQLRMRGEQLARGPQRRKADLRKGPQAENTEQSYAVPDKTQKKASKP